jgi:predicted ATPase
MSTEGNVVVHPTVIRILDRYKASGGRAIPRADFEALAALVTSDSQRQKVGVELIAVAVRFYRAKAMAVVAAVIALAGHAIGVAAAGQALENDIGVAASNLYKLYLIY